jgi:hypothetical protein
VRVSGTDAYSNEKQLSSVDAEMSLTHGIGAPVLRELVVVCVRRMVVEAVSTPAHTMMQEGAFTDHVVPLIPNKSLD